MYFCEVYRNNVIIIMLYGRPFLISTICISAFIRLEYYSYSANLIPICRGDFASTCKRRYIMILFVAAVLYTI